jgi:hypothetical protein
MRYALLLTLFSVVACAFSPPPPSPPLGTYGVEIQGLALAFDIPLAVWQTNPAYNSAVQNAVADRLGVKNEEIWIYQIISASQSGTVVTFSVIQSQQVSDITTESNSFPHINVEFTKLFESGEVGAPCLAPFVAALQQFGLNVQKCFNEDKIN